MTVEPAPRHVVVRFVVFFFLFGNLAGLITVYLPPYIKSLGFSSEELGRLLAIPPLITCFVPLVWAYIADRYRMRLAMLRLLLLALVVVFSAFYFVESGVGIAAALIGLALFRSGVMPLGDALALSNLSSTQYVKIVITNGLSWVVSTLLFAYFLAEEPPSEQWVLRVTHVLIAATALYSWFLIAKQQPAAEHPKLADTIALLGDRRVIGFLFSIMIYWTSMGPFETLLALHTAEMGYGPSAAGYAFSVAIVAEVLVLMFAKRFGYDLITIAAEQPRRARKLLVIVMGATALRWFASAVAPNMFLFLVLQAIHGLSFGAFFLLAVGHMRAIVPDKLRATGQAMLFSTLVGFGGMLGALCAGQVHGIGGSSLAFQVAGGIVLVAIVFVALSASSHQRDARPRD